ncbi:MAG: sigma-70 family RNA polymerase sigma factor [Pirellulaceae bacterium]
MRDDLVAEIMLGLVDQDYAVLRRFRGQSSLGTYLVVISRRIAVRKLAKMRRVSKAASELDANGTLVTTRVDAAHSARSSTAGISPEAWHVENVEEVQHLLASMPSEEATAIRMFHLENRSYSDIGIHFGIPENSVSPLLSRARDRMRELRS